MFTFPQSSKRQSNFMKTKSKLNKFEHFGEGGRAMYIEGMEASPPPPWLMISQEWIFLPFILVFIIHSCGTQYSLSLDNSYLMSLRISSVTRIR